MWTHIVSLLDSLAQTVVVWNGDIIVKIGNITHDTIRTAMTNGQNNTFDETPYRAFLYEFFGDFFRRVP